MNNELNALEFLQNELSKKDKTNIISFKEYTGMIRERPRRMLRNIFQLFHDMVKEYVKVEYDEYSEDPESIGFVNYDCTRLFIDGADNPFFADTPFANRFVRQIEGLRHGFQQNMMYAYDGPSGCGKSTFLNNLLRTFESYTKTTEGQTFEIVWNIDSEALSEGEGFGKLFVPCPSHDYPILIIPKKYRTQFLKKLLPKDPDMRKRIFEHKDYAWLFQSEACTICKSIFGALLDKTDSLDEVFEMMNVRRCSFKRRTGEGISIFNPGDKSFSGIKLDSGGKYYFSNKKIQEGLDKLFGADTVRYMYSSLAKTNNGIYGLMDVKAENRKRFIELHNVISEGVHKVGDVEERIQSLFFALMNEEDKSFMKEERMESLEGRIQYNPISYVLEPETEANIYRSIFGKSIDERFLPRVLENFARVIISSRMEEECKPQEEWIQDISKYKLYCDGDGLLLRMELYSNKIPTWLSEKDRKNFTAPVREAIISEGQKEGKEGFSGRQSISMFRQFFNSHSKDDSLTNMKDVTEFFKHGMDREIRNKNIPQNFLASLVDSYDYAVLNEVKESLYFYNKKQIYEDILNYLCVISYDIGDTVRCVHTGEEVEVTGDFLKLMARRITGKELSEESSLNFAREIQQKYVTILAGKQIQIKKTDLYRELLDAYVRNLKTQALEPFIKNKNFREAIKLFGDSDFDKLDNRLKQHVSHMINNLIEVFGYSEQGAKEICLYVLDNNLVDKFPMGLNGKKTKRKNQGPIPVLP